MPPIDTGLPLKNSGMLYVLVGSQMVPASPIEHQQQAEGHGQPDARGRPVEGAHDDPLDDDPEQRCRDEEHEGQRDDELGSPQPCHSCQNR